MIHARGRGGIRVTPQTFRRRDPNRAADARIAASTCDRHAAISKSWWSSWIATEPSPTADATRFTDPCRASPAASTDGTDVSRWNGERSSGHLARRSRSGPDVVGCSGSATRELRCELSDAEQVVQMPITLDDVRVYVVTK